MESLLLKEIQKGAKLKKAVTNDRSTPIVGKTANAPAAAPPSSSGGPAFRPPMAGPAGFNPAQIFAARPQRPASSAPSNPSAPPAPPMAPPAMPILRPAQNRPAPPPPRPAPAMQSNQIPRANSLSSRWNFRTDLPPVRDISNISGGSASFGKPRPPPPPRRA
jgi:hypothetical protein